jgi:hypothetical protein
MVKRPYFGDSAVRKRVGLRSLVRKLDQGGARKSDYPPGFLMARLCKINTALTEMKA